MVDKSATIFVAGHRGMVGSAIARKLQVEGFNNLLTCSHAELDLTNQAAVFEFYRRHAIDYVILAAAKVGGIHANSTYPADFIYENLTIECNVIGGAWHAGIKQLQFLGSSCIYPRLAEQPMSEEALLTGTLEPTNEPYALAKIAGIKLCESYNRQYGTDYRALMPTNLYGQGDNYHPLNSHVIPALIRRFHEANVSNASEIVIWGTGTPRREFLHVDDLAAASVHIMLTEKETYEQYCEPMRYHINVGTGTDITIHELARQIAEVAGYRGNIVFDTSKLDGAPQKKLNVERINALGWTAQIPLAEGLRSAYNWYVGSQPQRETELCAAV